jgi:hypothetical protein
LAAVLRYCFGTTAHIRTFTEKRGGTTFEFSDANGEAPAIAVQYFSDHGEGGFAVADARVLVDSFIEIRRTLTAAINDGGEWRNE